MLRSARKYFSRSLDLWIVFLTAVLLRVQYAASTSFDERNYDVKGHMEYVTHVFDTWSVPLSTAGWEMHQPPLYYFLAALYAGMGKILGVPGVLAWHNLQFLSLFLSVLALGAAVAAATTIFSRTQDQTKALIVAGFVGTLPGIVFMASRINNDALFTAVSLLFVLALLRWWQTTSERGWYLCVATLAVAMLTKLSAAPLALTLFGCLWFHPEIKPKRKKFLALAAIAALAVATGWYFGLRAWDSHLGKLVEPGIAGLNAKLEVSNDVSNLVTFSPVRILVTTYNDTWTDGYGRQFFWEFLFKSAYFGEWRFNPGVRLLHQAMLASGLFTVLLAALGVVRSFRRKWEFRVPLLLLLGLGAGGVLALRVLHNASCSQDFRYAPFIALPVAAFAAMGVDFLPQKYRGAAIAVVVSGMVLNAAFLLSL